MNEIYEYDHDFSCFISSSSTNTTRNDTDIISNLENKLNLLIHFYKNDLWKLSLFTNFLNIKSNIKDVLSLSDAIIMKLDIEEIKVSQKISESQFQSLESKYNKILLILQRIQDSNTTASTKQLVTDSTNDYTKLASGDTSTMVVLLSDDRHATTTTEQEGNICNTIECDPTLVAEDSSSIHLQSYAKRNSINDVCKSNPPVTLVASSASSNDREEGDSTTSMSATATTNIIKEQDRGESDRYNYMHEHL